MNYNGREISDELMEKAKACTSPEELLALSKEQNMELTMEELDAISGGNWKCPWYDPYRCPSKVRRGDEREGIDSAKVPADFVNGVVDGGELD